MTRAEKNSFTILSINQSKKKIYILYNVPSFNKALLKLSSNNGSKIVLVPQKLHILHNSNV